MRESKRPTSIEADDERGALINGHQLLHETTELGFFCPSVPPKSWTQFWTQTPRNTLGSGSTPHHLSRAQSREFALIDTRQDGVRLVFAISKTGGWGFESLHSCQAGRQRTGDGGRTLRRP